MHEMDAQMARVPSSAGRLRCRGCDGRGWRVASPTGRMRLDETAARLVRRPCPDCLGEPLFTAVAV